MEINLTPELPSEVQQAKSRYGIIGNDRALMAAIGRAVQVAPIDLSVLITGESGTGKEFFPKIIHGFSARKHSKYIAVNCGAIPEGTIDSELFGHEKGAFTGAVATRKGYFEEADGGTVFLDEVAELPLTTQARLLRVLESGEFLKVGSSTVQRTNIRIVAATNVDMAAAVAAGRFREDLYYRLSTVNIALPPLRERGTDILLLARKFAAEFAEKYRTRPISLADDARHALLHYRWPGNVRQLKNVVEQAALFEAGGEVSAQALQQYLPAISESYTPAVMTGAAAHTYEQERDLLFNMIFKLRGEIDRLSERLDSADAPVADVEATDVETAPLKAATRSLMKYDSSFGMPPSYLDATAKPEHPATLKPEHPATLKPEHPATLEDTEREMIRQSLERHSGRRKAVADELKISERTLYRKIKEYGLDDL